MNKLNGVLLISAFFLFAAVCFGQTKPDPNAAAAAKSSAAYAEVLLSRTELEAELEELLMAYKAEYPKVKLVQFRLASLNREIDKLFLVKPSEHQKLTAALGKLIVRKVELEGELWTLRNQFEDEHPDVKKAIRKVAVFESAIKDILF